MIERAGKWTAALLTLLAAFGFVLGACGGLADESVAPKQLSISMFDRGQVSSDEGTYRNNRWVQWIREKSGIYVTFVPVPRVGQDRLNVLLAAGEAPDLIWEYDRRYIGMLASQGVIQPVDGLLETYSTVYRNYLKEHPELMPYLSFNGQMYAVATRRPVTSVANHAIWIRQDWLDILGLQTPRTLDDLLHVAKAFRDRDPDGNGQADTLAFAGNEKADIISALFGTHRNEWFLEDGKVKYGPTTDRYMEAIRFEKQLHDEDLIDKEGKAGLQAWVDGKAGICLCQWSSPLLTDLMNNDADARPVPLEPAETRWGTYGLYQEEPPYIYVAFNKKMKDPETAVKYLDWMLEKGWSELVYGTEGEHMKTVNGIPQMISADKYRKEMLYAYEYAVLRQEKGWESALSAKAAPDPLSQRVARLQEEALQVALKHPYRRDFPYPPNFVEMNETITSIGQTFDTIKAKAVRLGPNYSPEWAMQEIRKEWRRAGGEQAEALIQVWYDNNKAGMMVMAERIGG
ncbi:hypothetical protein GCM10020370_67260 [Paenibacillus hodogayensis]